MQLSQSQIQAVGVSVGGLISVASVGLVWFIARRAKSKAKEHRGPVALDRNSAVFDDDFFEKRPAWWASTLLHVGIAFAAIALCVAQAFVALGSDHPPTTSTIDKTLVLAGGLQLALLALMGVCFVAVPVVFRRANARVSWAAAVLAFAITNAFLSGTVLWFAKYLAGLSSRTRAAHLELGNELALVDAFFLVAVLWAAIIGVVVLMRSRRRWLPRSCRAGQPIPDSWRTRVRGAQATALVVHKIDLLVVALAVAFVGVGVAVGFGRTNASATWPWQWVIDGPSFRGVGYSAAAWALPAFVVFVLVRVRAAASDNRTRRFFGQCWDVLSFWPRQFHPFAVRPYSYVAVPELRSKINHLREKGSVIVSAHSQGSVLAVSALAPEADLGDVALVTYGSHVPTLYRRSFNAYFNAEAVDALHAKLADDRGPRWHNFYRLTDPIGGPMFATAPAADGEGPGVDHCLPDPAVKSEPSVEIPPPLERDREPGADLAVHSHYLNEPELKQCVRTLRSRLSQPITAAARDSPVR